MADQDRGLTLVRLHDVEGGYRASLGNLHVGDIIVDVDGYYKYWPVSRGGFWDEYYLTLVLNTLKDLNAKWDKEVNDYFENAECESKGQETPKGDT